MSKVAAGRKQRINSAVFSAVSSQSGWTTLWRDASMKLAGVELDNWCPVGWSSFPGAVCAVLRACVCVCVRVCLQLFVIRGAHISIKRGSTRSCKRVRHIFKRPSFDTTRAHLGWKTGARIWNLLSPGGGENNTVGGGRDSIRKIYGSECCHNISPELFFCCFRPSCYSPLVIPPHRGPPCHGDAVCILLWLSKVKLNI